MTKDNTNWSETNLPERLFVLGAGPSLELLYPFREEIDSWGHWVVQRCDIVKPFLEFTKPLYSISYWKLAKTINAGYGIQLVNPSGKKNYGESSIGTFISHFESYSGKELLLFGYDGTGNGYWRQQVFQHKNGDGAGKDHTKKVHIEDVDNFNKLYAKNSCSETKLFHLGKTTNIHVKQLSIKEIKKLIKK